MDRISLPAARMRSMSSAATLSMAGDVTARGCPAAPVALNLLQAVDEEIGGQARHVHARGEHAAGMREFGQLRLGALVPRRGHVQRAQVGAAEAGHRGAARGQRHCGEHLPSGCEPQQAAPFVHRDPVAAFHVHGGAIHNHGQLLLTESTVSGSAAEATGPWGGGAITNAGNGTATLRNVTIAGNRTAYFGGGTLMGIRLSACSRKRQHDLSTP